MLQLRGHKMPKCSSARRVENTLNSSVLKILPIFVVAIDGHHNNKYFIVFSVPMATLKIGKPVH